MTCHAEKVAIFHDILVFVESRGAKSTEGDPLEVCESLPLIIDVTQALEEGELLLGSDFYVSPALKGRAGGNIVDRLLPELPDLVDGPILLRKTLQARHCSHLFLVAYFDEVAGKE